MSILQDYEKARKELGDKKYNAIDKYLAENKDKLLSDVLYKEEEYNKFEEWYNAHISELQVENKPKCALIGQDGNIFNLMGIASRTLKNNGMKEEAKEMCDRIVQSKSYSEALCIMTEYVEVTDEAGLEEDEEEYE